MKAIKLSTANVRTVMPDNGRDEQIIFDSDLPGLGLRIRGESRTLVFQYKLGDKQRRKNLGPVNAVNFAEIRKTAEKWYARVKLGEDPAADVIEAKAKAVETFGALTNRYLAYQKTRPRKNGTIGLKPRSYEEIERHLLIHCKPLHGLQLGAVNRQQVAARLSDITENSGPVAANRVRSTLSGFFTWCGQEGLTESNPAGFTREHEEHERDRVLTPGKLSQRDRQRLPAKHAELYLIWNSLPLPGDDYGDICRLLLLTGQRRDQIGSLHWSEIVDDGEAILLPKARTKHGRHEHRIELSPPARAILEARTRVAGRDLIFGRGEGGFSGWSNCKERLDAALLEACKSAGLKPIPHFTTHDFRRTVDTMMAELGILPHVVEACIDHTLSGHKSGVVSTYNYCAYDSAKADAFLRWAEHLMAIVECRDAKVVTLQRQA